MLFGIKDKDVKDINLIGVGESPTKFCIGIGMYDELAFKYKLEKEHIPYKIINIAASGSRFFKYNAPENAPQDFEFKASTDRVNKMFEYMKCIMSGNRGVIKCFLQSWNLNNI